ncbi:hypothetical protein O0I10_009909 [Lichtheimia ornata]|uniref:BHLH domain-containing protein n=1 Tax=Lichtheimia ornata TaxID=688661 RepID=A0AAD7UVR1_9FUNG|nr:uncharacterized protein O0I10_009909 [Lichtheimia ornata]KAJ8654468.1 hypothetical protein O0I10_009909 [Lichtheimia ornata]
MNDHQWMLQEPVPFEEFEFSMGVPDFSIPFPTSDELWASSTNTSTSSASSTSVLNETDQQEFSRFLDSFFVDDDEEERRRVSILQSLDEQKRRFQPYPTINKSNKKPHLPPSPTTAGYMMSSSPSHTSTSSSSPSPDSPSSSALHHGMLSSSSSRRRKSGRELLSEEEKRANHIASEQKRRSTIRNGFKDLTDLVPSLKNMNNSKSNVLFQAVEFIKYLEQRNRGLQSKIKSLEYRMACRMPDDQSRRLLKLQEQLQFHQRLLSQQQALKERSGLAYIALDGGDDENIHHTISA